MDNIVSAPGTTEEIYRYIRSRRDRKVLVHSLAQYPTTKKLRASIETPVYEGTPESDKATEAAQSSPSNATGREKTTIYACSEKSEYFPLLGSKKEINQ